MNESQALERMVPPGRRRPHVCRGGVLQIHVTRACNLACVNCTQASHLGGKMTMMPPELFEDACRSLRGYFGVIGVFGGNPAMSTHFEAYCEILRRYFPQEQCGLWCNHPRGKGAAMRRTFNPAVSNLNVHMDREAYDEFRRTWPEARPFGLDKDSRHSPPWVAMRDVLKIPCSECEGRGGHWNGVGLPRNDWDCERCAGSGEIYDESRAWELIAGCDINQNWSALIGMFRGQLRGWFCEIAGAQAMLHQWEEDYPDTGISTTPLRRGEIMVRDAEGRRYYNVQDPQGAAGLAQDRWGIAACVDPWWQLPMTDFAHQVRKHCHECGIPLRGYGDLAVEGRLNQTSAAHAGVYKPKRKEQLVQIVARPEELGERHVAKVTDYVGNAKH